MRIFNLILSSLLISFASFDLTLLLAQEILVKPYVQPGDGNTLEGTDVKIIDSFTMTAATNINFYDGINCENGLYVVISGTASITVYFE